MWTVSCLMPAKKKNKDFSHFQKCCASGSSPQEEIHFWGNYTKNEVFS